MWKTVQNLTKPVFRFGKLSHNLDLWNYFFLCVCEIQFLSFFHFKLAFDDLDFHQAANYFIILLFSGQDKLFHQSNRNSTTKSNLLLIDFFAIQRCRILQLFFSLSWPKFCLQQRHIKRHRRQGLEISTQWVEIFRIAPTEAFMKVLLSTRTHQLRRINQVSRCEKV